MTNKVWLYILEPKSEKAKDVIEITVMVKRESQEDTQKVIDELFPESDWAQTFSQEEEYETESFEDADP